MDYGEGRKGDMTYKNAVYLLSITYAVSFIIFIKFYSSFIVLVQTYKNIKTPIGVYIYSTGNL